MRIALDARTILSPKTGDRTYTLNLLRCLPQAAPDMQFLALLDGPLPKELAGLFDPERVEFVVQPRPRGKLWTALALPRLARRFYIDLVHLQYIAPLSLPCRYVCTIQDLTFRLFPEWYDYKDLVLLNRLIPRSARRAARVIAPSECTKRDLMAAYRLPAEKIVVTPEAAAPEYYLPQSPAAVAEVRARHGLEKDYFLFVGTLQPRKNLPRLLEAFASAQTGGATLAIVGKQGWQMPDLQALIIRLGLGFHVKLLGYIPDEDLPPLYAGADALLFPTLYEGFGLPVLEAMAAGTPVLTSGVSALPEVAGEAALLVDPNSVEEIAAGITRLASEPELRESLAQAGRARAAEFSWERTAALTVAAYRAALG